MRELSTHGKLPQKRFQYHGSNHPDFQGYKTSYAYMDITGPNLACPLEQIWSYSSVPSLANVSSYNWSRPAGWTYLGGGPQDQHVQAPGADISGAFTLRVTNSCGESGGSPEVHYVSQNYSCGGGLIVYSNPISNRLLIDKESLNLSKKEIEELKGNIIAIDGRIVWTGTATELIEGIYLNLNPGLYWLSIYNLNGDRQNKVVIVE